MTLWITFGIYLIALLAIMADLWSGVRKAKKTLPGKLVGVSGYEKDTVILNSKYNSAYFADMNMDTPSSLITKKLIEEKDLLNPKEVSNENND